MVESAEHPIGLGPVGHLLLATLLDIFVHYGCQPELVALKNKHAFDVKNSDSARFAFRDVAMVGRRNPWGTTVEVWILDDILVELVNQDSIW